MERLNFFCYNMGHETPWIPRGTGKAPSTCDRVPERRQDDSFSRSAFGGSIQELRFPMVPRVPRGRFQGPSFKGDSRTSSEAVSKGEKEISGTTFVGSAGCRVSNRPLDLETDCPNHPQALWHPLSPQSCVAGASRDGMELPETRAARFAKERERDCALEGLSVAPYKKKPKDLEPVWSSSMSLASCSFQTSVALGLPKDKPRSSITSTNRTGFPPSVLCRCPRSGNAWLFISGFGRAILTVWMFVLSLKNCSNISGAPWSCCGIGGPSIDVKKSSSFSLNILGFIWNTFLPMLLNLTPQNMSGIRPIVPFPIVYQRGWPNSKQCCKTQHEGSGNPKDFFGLASLLRIFLGPDRSFHYLCETQ
jgi:hypothetical protein